MDPILRQTYLEAMGIQLWQLQAGGGWNRDEQEGGVTRGEGVQALAHHAPSPDSFPMLEVPVTAPWSPTSRSLSRSSADSKGLDWDELRASVAACRVCSLWQTRTQTVFGVGRRDADLMLIGEAPGADEDRQGEPFVGRAGQLLNRMLVAIGLDRSQVYIANILKCRPPGNRDPRPEEAAACRTFLTRQIDWIQPRIILSLGRVSAQNLLGTGESVSRLRGRWFGFGPDAIPLMVTFHPSYLLRSPEQKALVWRDLTQVARRLQGLEGLD
jgi:uracil-DNA glycosylase